MSAPSIPRIRNRPKAMDQSLQFFWNPPASGSVLGYTLSDGTNTYTPSSSPYTVTGLTNGQLYSFSLLATNEHGNSPIAYFTPVRPGLYPDPPTDVSATYSGPWATITWTNPVNTGETDLLGTVLTAIPLSNNQLIADKTQYVRQCVVPPSLTSANLFLSSLQSNVQYKVLVQSVNDPGYSRRTSYTSTIGTAGTIITDGLLVYLDATSYSGSGTWIDSGSNGFDATVENGTPSFNGSNGIVLDGSTNFLFNNPGLLSTFTASLWYKNTGAATDSACIVTETFTTGSINLLFPMSNETSFYGGFFNGAFQLGQPCDYSDGQWHNQVLSWDGTTLTTYFDNSFVGTVTPGSGPGSGGNPYRIGRRWDSANYITGVIGQVLIYNRAISSGEIGSNYAATSGVFA